jgi:hypothetical protein
MTLDQKIQIWNTVGTWLAGIATFAAVIVSLHLARRSERVKLKVLAGIRLVVGGDGTPPEEHLNISVTNLGDRAVVLNTVGWAVGKRKERRYCIQTVSGFWTAQYPTELAHGKQASFMVSFAHTPTWLTEFANGFLKSISDSDLDTLVAQVHTSVGQTIEAKPEKELIDRLRKARKDG